VRLADPLIDLKQNFSKQVFGYFLAAKSDKERMVAGKIDGGGRIFFSLKLG
jgi:hypothetical protein